MAPARDRGLSTVVGAAILIGIVVVLATVVAGFVFTKSPSGQVKPDTKIEISQSIVDRGPTSDCEDPTTCIREDVLEIETAHIGGEDVPQETLSVTLFARSDNDTATGYLLHYNNTRKFNVSEPGWNSDTPDRIVTGDEETYHLFVTERISTDDGSPDQIKVNREPREIWRAGKCHISRFENNRAEEGRIEMTDSQGGTWPGLNDADCSLGSPSDRPDNKVWLESGTIDEGGRIAPGDTVRVIWEPSGGSSGATLAKYDVEKPDG